MRKNIVLLVVICLVLSVSTASAQWVFSTESTSGVKFYYDDMRLSFDPQSKAFVFWQRMNTDGRDTYAVAKTLVDTNRSMFMNEVMYLYDSKTGKQIAENHDNNWVPIYAKSTMETLVADAMLCYTKRQ